MAKIINLIKGSGQNNPHAILTTDHGVIINLHLVQRIDVNENLIYIYDVIGEIHTIDYNSPSLDVRGQPDAQALVEDWYDNDFFYG